MKFLVDSDFLVALYKPDDSNHKRATDIFKKVEKSDSLLILNIVLQESTTVISKHMGMKYAKNFYSSVFRMASEKIIMDEELENESWKIFLSQTKKGTSFVDCANLAVVEKYKLDGILSFDKFYPKDVRIA